MVPFLLVREDCYTAEYAEQELTTEAGDDFSMPYYFVEAATKLAALQ